MASKKRAKPEEERDPVVKRLDALLRLIIETNKKDKGEFNEASAARLLKSAGLTPTEIAHVLGKESATDVSPYLYPKKKSKAKGSTSQPESGSTNNEKEESG
jgi:hypothetical protein